MELADRLQQLRKGANFSQEQLSDMLDISRQAISKWESGQATPDIQNVIKLCEIYKVSADYILTGKETTTPTPTPTPLPTANKGMSKELKTALAVLMVVGGTALITVIFIAFLGLLATKL